MLGLALVLAGAVTVDVPVHLGVPLSPVALERALEEVDALFAPGDVSFRWSVSPERLAVPPLVTVVVQAKPARKRVHGCSRNLHDHRLGHTHLGSRYVTLWSEQVARAVDGDWDREDPPEVDERVFATALGRVLAHELGHLFLRLNGHNERGLMRRSFSHRSLVSRSRRAFRLSEHELEAIRRAVEASSPARSPAR